MKHPGPVVTGAAVPISDSRALGHVGRGVGGPENDRVDALGDAGLFVHRVTDVADDGL
ncbi:hypothetical protein [Haloarcula pellucida]|uniref:Uncharacterized protein n=1 Tax=Haloarcula pellucida TaxID=1427151 RepID=A0A830GPC5_9EURY|nr:hypothetical protein [Halomicroarcula pellucida]MBX0349185.1 hypothetical protein [Halomicroarcula pellucida]GGN99401.1 hypothetical protein GCM10009030_30910 [Halomicroarcula pellucida]